MHTLSLGLIMGLAAGLAPGPLQTLVLAQSARFGWRAGATSALAPLATDAIIVAVTIGVAGLVPRPTLDLVSAAGAVLLGYLAVDTWRSASSQTHASKTLSGGGNSPSESSQTVLPAGAPSFWRASLVNLVNPHAWLFWAIVGAPMTLVASATHRMAGLAFIVPFFVGLVGVLVLLAILVGRGVRWLGTGFQQGVVRGSAAALAIIALLLLTRGLYGMVHVS